MSLIKQYQYIDHRINSIFQMATEYSSVDILSTWKTSNRVTEFFFEHLPTELWDKKIPGMPRKTICMLAGHIHNARCMWLKMIGKQYALKIPKSVDRRTVTQNDLLKALKLSNQGMIELLSLGLNSGGEFKGGIPWNNIPPDVLHFMTYIIAHEAHHRGQIILAARQLGHRLPPNIIGGIWQWKQQFKESNKK